MMTLAQYLKDNQMSQREFARLADLSPSYFNEILHGIKAPGLIVAAKIERLTDGKVPMSALLPVASGAASEVTAPAQDIPDARLPDQKGAA